MAKIIEKTTALYDYQAQYILAHSLGALISTYYLANYDHQIKKAVLSSPFFGVPMKHPLRDEVIIATMMAFGQGHRYAFGKGHYKPADLNLNELSHSKTRMKWMNRVNRKRSAIHLGGPTFRWVHLCLNAIKALPKIIPRVETPVLILQAEKEKIVDNKNLEKLTALFLHAESMLVPQAKHEILFEKDNVRKAALERVNQFLHS